MSRRADRLTRFPSEDQQANRFMDRVVDLVNPVTGDVAPVTLLQRVPDSPPAEDAFSASVLRAASTVASGIAQQTVVPTSSSSFGQPGMVCADLSFLYFCVAPNLWRRVAISSF